MALPAGVPANGRFSARTIAQRFAQCRAADAASKLALKFTSDAKKKSLRGTVQATITMADNSVATYDFANARGQHATFGDVDAPVKAMCEAAEVSQVTVVVESSGVWDRPVPSDLVKAKAAEVVRLNAAKTKNTETIAAIDAQLALMVGWETGTLAQQTRKAEEATKRATVVADSATIDARIAALA